MDAIQAKWCTELLYGGARGGGKSDFILGDYLQDLERYGKNWQGIVFRRTLPQLEELIGRSNELFPQAGGRWLEQKKRWEFTNGAKLRFRFLERDRDVENYMGHQYPWIAFEELGNFPSSVPYHRMKACLRWAAADVPTKRMRSSANPGGPGQGWIKEYFVDHAPLGFRPRVDPDTQHEIMFIPARVTDNQILLERDPGYINRLRGVGSPEIVRAWLEGDWNAIVGGYFPEFGAEHIIEPMEFPKHWTKWRAFDWGSSKPFCCLWMTVSDGCIPRFPVGAIIVYREYYGASAPNVGLKRHVRQVADGILQRDGKDVFTYSVADPSIFIQDGGPSIAETFSNSTVRFRPGDNKRIPGWTQIRNRLIGHDNRAMLYIVGAACPNLVRTFPVQQHDESNAEDMDTEGEDHALDTLRYGCMSRPYTQPRPKVEPIRGMSKITYGEFLAEDKRLKNGRRERI